MGFDSRRDMADDLPEPIPQELRDAFWAAIGAYGNWRYGRPEPKVSLRQEQTAISWICELATKHDDPMPADLLSLLISAAPHSEEPPRDQSFASGARFLQKLIRDKQHRFNLMDRL